MIQSLATKKRIAWGGIVKRMKEHGCTIADLENFPMLLKRSFLDAPYIHKKTGRK
jgi:hypothetical protein